MDECRWKYTLEKKDKKGYRRSEEGIPSCVLMKSRIATNERRRDLFLILLRLPSPFHHYKRRRMNSISPAHPLPLSHSSHLSWILPSCNNKYILVHAISHIIGSVLSACLGKCKYASVPEIKTLIHNLLFIFY